MRSPAIAYVLREFPYPSETFIAHEILALERRGLQLRIYSYRRPQAQPSHDVFRRIATPVTYLPDPIPSHLNELRKAHRTVQQLDRARYRRVARYALGRTIAERDIDALRRFAHAGALASALLDGGVSHMHAHFARGASRVAMLASMLTDVPFSFTAHARDIYTNDVRRAVLREQVARAASVVTVSEDNRAFLEREAGAPAGKVRVVYNGVDLAQFAPDAIVRREEGLVLGVGRLVEKKGFTHLIEASRLLRERGVALRVEIVGGGPERSRLIAQTRDAGLEGIVTFAGERSQEELASYYRRASVVALPAVVARDGNRDALPTVLLEAMACGTPVVSTRLGGIPEIVTHGDDGLLVASGDAPALADAIGTLLGDAGLRTRLGATARATAQQRFDVDRNVAALQELFAQEAPVAAG